MDTYTVIGWVEDDSGDLHIAGIVRGRLEVRGPRRGDTPGYRRYVEYIEAENYEAAEMWCEHACYADDDEEG